MAIKTANDYLEESWSWKRPEQIDALSRGVAWLMSKGFTTNKDLRQNEGFIHHDKVQLNMRVWLEDRREVCVIATGAVNHPYDTGVGWTAEYVFEDRSVEAFAFGLRGACDIPAIEADGVERAVIAAIREASAICELYDLDRSRDDEARRKVAEFLADRRDSDTMHQLKAEDCRYVPLIKED